MGGGKQEVYIVHTSFYVSLFRFTTIQVGDQSPRRAERLIQSGPMGSDGPSLSPGGDVVRDTTLFSRAKLSRLLGNEAKQREREKHA